MINAKKEKPISRVAVGNLYDLNKDLIEKQTSPLTSEELAVKKEMVHDFLRENGKASYMMLLCHEQRDYTLFNLTTTDDFAIYTPNILIDECLKNRGEIRSIELTANKDAIEIWLVINKKAYCYYFFDYTNGVIEV